MWLTPLFRTCNKHPACVRPANANAMQCNESVTASPGPRTHPTKQLVSTLYLGDDSKGPGLVFSRVVLRNFHLICAIMEYSGLVIDHGHS